MNKVRVGIIGLGRWGMCHLEAYHSLAQAEVVAVCDSSEERLELARSESPAGIRRMLCLSPMPSMA